MVTLEHVETQVRFTAEAQADVAVRQWCLGSGTTPEEWRGRIMGFTRGWAVVDEAGRQWLSLLYPAQLEPA